MHTKNWLCLSSLLSLMLAVGVSTLKAETNTPPSMTFGGQMSALAAELLEFKDPEVLGRKLQLTKIVSKYTVNSDFTLRVEKELSERLASILDPNANLLLSGEIDYFESDSKDNNGFKVFQIKLVVVNQKRKQLAWLLREVNDTVDIASMLQLTLAPPDTRDYAKRNKAADEANTTPQFDIVPGTKTQVSAKGMPRYSMEVRRRENGKGNPIPVAVDNLDGRAFASVGIDDTYEVVCYNYDTESDAVVKLEIDGLDAVDTFNSDKAADGTKIHYPGYFIPKAIGTKPGEIVVSGWLNTVKSSEENVFKFVVKKLGQGVASELNVRSKTGIITSRFFDACEPDGKLRARNFGETGKGEGMQVNFAVKPVQMAEKAISIVSIRYSRSPAP